MTTLELAGIGHELKFWKDFVKTDRFLKGWVADIPTPELQPAVKQFFDGFMPKGYKVLDVGSGVVSLLNGTVPKEDLTAVDPLGELYECIFDYKKYGIAAPLPVPAEELQYQNEFEVVHISNALDHSQDPELAYQKLLAAVKPGGWLIIQGFENEATFENWQGFHQYNISLMGNVLVIKNRIDIYYSIDATSLGTTVKLDTGKDWFIWISQKPVA